MVEHLYTVFGLRIQDEPKVKIDNIILGDYITETTNGIFSIEVTAYGDDLKNPYIEVKAIYQVVALATWHRVRNSLNTKLWYE